MTHDATDEARPPRAPRVDFGDVPYLKRSGHATQLIVDGAPYLALGGELHNSSPSSPAYMAPIWDKLARNNVRTVIGAASWQLVEPEEGQFDFFAVDDQIRQAHQRGMRLVLIWFGSYKNAESSYAPSWVRRDEERFPRAQRNPETTLRGLFPIDGPILTPFSERLMDADARAFAALMRRIREVDEHGTVIMMQVQNEIGLLGESRDRSPLAEDAWAGQVPEQLIAHLRTHRTGLRPWLTDLWERHGALEHGTWAEVFGTDRAADEVFMSWAYSRFIEHVTAAGIAEHPLPMYANAWLGPQPGAEEPGLYPSGGPVARMMDVWNAGAPSIAFLSPDIYLDDFSGTLADYRRDNNPIFIPEARLDAALIFIALGEYHAIGFNPFGIEEGADDDDVFRAYGVLNEMTEEIAAAQADNRIRGFSLLTGEQQTSSIGDFELAIRGPIDTRGMFGIGTGAESDATVGYGLVIQSSPDEFIVVARGASIRFLLSDADVEWDLLQEGEFRAGHWHPGRTLNGDERYFLFPNSQLRAVKIRVLRRPH